MADLTVRHLIYSTLAETGRAPTLLTIAAWLWEQQLLPQAGLTDGFWQLG